MTAVVDILSLLLIAEFVFAPVNLWTGRTMPNFVRFTGMPPEFATKILAPLKLATAVVLAIGLVVPVFTTVGCVATIAICVFYLARLIHPGRRDAAGIAGFTIFAAIALAALLLRVSA